ncbi:hypothetical protein ACA910_017039 [Epithemia clementina (nom. ined.)]
MPELAFGNRDNRILAIDFPDESTELDPEFVLEESDSDKDLVIDTEDEELSAEADEELSANADEQSDYDVIPAEADGVEDELPADPIKDANQGVEEAMNVEPMAEDEPEAVEPTGDNIGQQGESPNHDVVASNPEHGLDVQANDKDDNLAAAMDA